jgi:adenylate cyclase
VTADFEGKRRLAAIICMDVVGFSRLVGADEDGTIARIRATRREVLDPLVQRHQGRVIKSTGDGLLAEFASAVKAVDCAVAVQRTLNEREAAGSEDKRIALRIGINIGDIIVESDGDVLGDGVNVAARVEALCKPGGICISGVVHDQVRDKVSYLFKDRGEQAVKNIARPVRIFDLSPEALPAFVLQPEVAEPQHKSDPASKPELPLPDKPSIAVLPFANMSGDPEQEYFADGMTEDVITALSQARQLFVIARNSTFVYKGRSDVDEKQVGRDLGVHFVLEGSVRKMGTRVRITAQLIDAISGQHAWAKKFDGEIEELFELQDRVTASIVAAISPAVATAGMARVRAKPTESLHGYDLFLKALSRYYALTSEGLEEAIALLGRALTADPNFHLAKAFMAHCHAVRRFQGRGNVGEDSTRALKLARTALHDVQDDPLSLAMCGVSIGIVGRDFETAFAALDRSLSIYPNSAFALMSRAWLHVRGGDWQTAVSDFRASIRLNPLDPEAGWTENGLCMAYLRAGDYEQALHHALNSVSVSPNLVSGRRVLIASLVLTGREEEARRAVSDLLALAPESTLKRITAILQDIRDENCRVVYVDALRRAGIPEE